MPDGRLNLLLVEDNAADAFLIQEALEAQPEAFSLVWEQRLSRGLDRIIDAPPDVILLDLGLPDSQGIETFRRIQQAGPHLPVVVLTASANDELALRTLREGAQDYLVKGGVTISALLRVLRHSHARERAGADALVRARDAARLEKLAALGELLAGVTHEVNNPLTLVDGNAELALATLDEALDGDVPDHLRDLLEVTRAHVDKVRQGARMLGGVSHELERTVRSRATVRAEADLAHVMAGALALLHRRLDGVEVTRDLRSCRILVDEDALRDAFMRVLQNALEALAEAPVRRIRVSTGWDGEQARVVIEDTGPGVPRRLRPLVFDPFVTTKHSNFGLGLTTVQAVLRAHGGTVRLDDSGGRGALVEMRLPRAA